MTDIVERLKECVNHLDFDDRKIDLLDEAVDEIERLREVNKKLQQDYYDCMEKLEYIHSMGKDICD